MSRVLYNNVLPYHGSLFLYDFTSLSPHSHPPPDPVAAPSPLTPGNSFFTTSVKQRQHQNFLEKGRTREANIVCYAYMYVGPLLRSF